MQLLAWAIQNKADPKSIKRYVDTLSLQKAGKKLRTELALTPGGPFFPILYFAVERNSPEIVRILCNAGANPSDRARLLGLSIIKLPLLAYTVLSAENDLSDTTDTMIALLAMGANPGDVPKDMWEDYVKAPRKDTPQDEGGGNAGCLWCTPELREGLCRNLNLSQRYALWKANQIEQSSVRMRQFAEAD